MIAAWDTVRVSEIAYTPKPTNIAELKSEDCHAIAMEWFATGVHW